MSGTTRQFKTAVAAILREAVEAELGRAFDHNGFVRTAGRNQRILTKTALEATEMIFFPAEVEKLNPIGDKHLASLAVLSEKFRQTVSAIRFVLVMR